MYRRWHEVVFYPFMTEMFVQFFMDHVRTIYFVIDLRFYYQTNTTITSGLLYLSLNTNQIK